MLQILIYLFLTSTVYAYGDTDSPSSLNTGPSSLSTVPSDQTKAKPVPGSNILSLGYEMKEGSATDFLITQIKKLEKTVNSNSRDQDKKIRTLVSSVLDLDRLGRRALIAHWSELGKSAEGKQKRARYLELFKDLVEENYLEKARQYVSGKYQIPLTEEVNFEDSDISIVKGKILKTDVDLLVEFKIQKQASGYKVIDVRLDETSLESTYRGSFNRIIRKKGGLNEGFPELLRVMNKRLAELKKGSATRL